MSRRAIWVDDESTTNCTKCKVEFGFGTFKHHCRKCGLIYCGNCSASKLLIPAEELVPRPQVWIQQKLNDIGYDEDSYRVPQRVCDRCSHVLRNIQGQLRLSVSKYNQDMYVDYNPLIPSLPALNFQLG